MSDEWVNTHGRVPRWVKRECGKIWHQNDKGSESFLTKSWIVKGRHCDYGIEFVGQHGSTTVIYKRKQGGGHKQHRRTSLLGKIKDFIVGK
jgi:hypothetical protein